MDSLSKQFIDGLKKLVQISKILFTPVAVSFLFIIVWRNIDIFLDIFNKIRLELFVIAVIGWSILYIFYPIMLLILCRSWDQKLSFKSIYYIYINRLPAKYIPGGVWHTVARFADFSLLGLKKRQLTAILFLENILPLGVTLLLGGTILLNHMVPQSWSSFVLTGVVFGGTILVFSLLFVNRIILDDTDKIQVITFIWTLLILLFYWLLTAFIFILYLQALPENANDPNVIRVGGVYLFSWGVGYMAFFAPQGIGIFEFVSAELLSGDLDIMTTAVLIAGFRVIGLFADVLSWGALKLLGLFRS